MAVAAPLELTYSSDIVIRDRELLSTLAVFYDQIWLPYPYDSGPDRDFRLFRLTKFDPGKNPEDKEYFQWHRDYQILFDEGIFQTSSPAIKRKSRDWTDDQEKVLMLAASTAVWRNEQMESPLEIYQVVDLAAHAVFTCKRGTETFCRDLNQNSSTKSIAAVMVNSIFSYEVPLLRALEPEDIIELRNQLKSTKEGFLDYLSTLADSVESRLRDGRSGSESIQVTVEREVLPQYHEFSRQSLAKRTESWAKVLSPASAFLKFAAMPLDPSSWADLIKSLLDAGSDFAERRFGCLTNENQAFRYIAQADRFVKSHAASESSMQSAATLPAETLTTYEPLSHKTTQWNSQVEDLVEEFIETEAPAAEERIKEAREELANLKQELQRGKLPPNVEAHWVENLLEYLRG